MLIVVIEKCNTSKHDRKKDKSLKEKQTVRVNTSVGKNMFF